MAAPPPMPPIHQPCPHHHQPQCGGSGPFATTYFSHFDGYIYVRNPKEPERSGSGGRGRERTRRLPKRPPPNHQPFMPQPMSMEAAGCFRPSVPYYVADTLPGGEPVAAAGNYRGSEEEEECASSGSGEDSTIHTLADTVAGPRNSNGKTKQNLATDRTPRSVLP